MTSRQIVCFSAVIMFCAVAGSPARAQKKKLSLAELAAIEWKLEQAGNTLTQSPDKATRLQAVDELASLTDPRSAPPLATALREDPDAGVRAKAAEALAALRTPEAKGLLTLVSTADPDQALRSRAAELLKPFPRKMTAATLPLTARGFKPPKGKLTPAVVQTTLSHPSGDARLWAVQQLATVAVPNRDALLGRALLSDPSARVRVQAARTLFALQKEKGLPSLIKAVEDGDPAVRFELAGMLAEFGDAGALTVLQKLATSDADATVRAEARDSLEPSTPVGRKLLEARVKKLSSANPTDRMAALGELSAATHWRAMAPLSCTLLRDKSAIVRAAAAKTLSDMHDATVLTAIRVAAELESDAKLQAGIKSSLLAMRKRVDTLIAQLKSADANQRVLAARALGQAAYPPGLDPLIAATKDKEARVRLAAVSGLANFIEPKAKDALKLAGTDADPKVRKAVDRHFKEQQQLDSWRAVYRDPNRLVMKATDPDPIWRFDAAIALGILGAERATVNLADLLLHDKEESVRHAAAWALVLMASDQGTAALKAAAAKDPSEKIRLTARKYLVIDKVNPDDLIAQLEDEEPSVRWDAAEALSLRATGKALNPLIRAALCDPEQRVRSTALRGLARIGNPLAKTVIRIALGRDADPRVRRTAMVMHLLAGGK